MTKESIKMFDKMLDFAVKHPDITPDRVLVISMKEDTLKTIFTQSRIELIKTVKSKSPHSVGELADMLDRPVESVSRDLKILENYGLLELVQVGKLKQPVVEKDTLLIPITA